MEFPYIILSNDKKKTSLTNRDFELRKFRLLK